MSQQQADAEFDEFVGSAWSRLRWSAYMLTGDHHAAEDLAQTALVKTYAAWRRVRRDDAMAFARRTMVNANIDRLRRRRVHEVLGAEPDVARPRDSGVDDRDELVRMLATLTERERKVVVLRHYFDLAEATVAEELRISVGTVKSTTSKALAKLRARSTAQAMEEVG